MKIVEENIPYTQLSSLVDVGMEDASNEYFRRFDGIFLAKSMVKIQLHKYFKSQYLIRMLDPL